MKSFFNPDNFLMKLFANLADIMFLNAICLICCLPVVTVGASLSALHYVTIKMAKNEEGYIIKDFFKAFKENFRQSTLLWLIFLAITAVFYLDLRIIKYGGMELPWAVSMIICATYLFCCITFMYAFVLLARFSNSIKQTLRNAFLMSMLHIGQTIVMSLIYLIPVVLIPVNYNFIGVYMLLGLAGPAYVNGYLWKNIFKKYEPVEEGLRKPDEMKEAG